MIEDVNSIEITGLPAIMVAVLVLVGVAVLEMMVGVLVLVGVAVLEMIVGVGVRVAVAVAEGSTFVGSGEGVEVVTTWVTVGEDVAVEAIEEEVGAVVAVIGDLLGVAETVGFEVEDGGIVEIAVFDVEVGDSVAGVCDATIPGSIICTSVPSLA